MRFSIKFPQWLFLLIFSCLLFILLLFGETFLGMYVMGFFSLFLVGDFLFKSGKNHFFSKQITHFMPFFVLWMLFFVGMMVSSLFTHSIPLTLQSWLFYLFIFLSFMWGVGAIKIDPNKEIGVTSLRKQKIDFDQELQDLSQQKFSGITVNQLLFSMILVVFELIILSLLFTIFPEARASIPGMNVLVATYGHSHLASVILLILPISWFYSIVLFRQFSKGYKTRRLSDHVVLLAPLIFTVALVASFGRTASSIGFAQTIMVGWFVRKSFLQFSFRKISLLGKFAIASICVFFIVALGFKAYFSFAIASEKNCPVTVLQKQLCKPITAEPRPEYWRQAITAVSDFPMTGYGPGTYALISQRYQDFNQLYTGYAHNAFLQIFAEMGLFVGMVFIVLISMFIWKTFDTEFKDPKLHHFILLSLWGISLNALVDFDWSFSGNLMISMLLFVAVIKLQNRQLKPYRTFFKKYVSLFQNCSIYLVSGLIITFASIGLISEFLIYLKQANTVVSIFPYISFHRKLLFFDSNLSQENRRKMLDIYRYHPEAYQEFKLDKNKDESLIKKDYEQLFETDPTNFEYFEEYVDLVIATKDDQQILETFEEIAQKLREFEQTRNYKFDYLLSKKIAVFSTVLANELFQAGEHEKSVQALQVAQKLDEWALDSYQPPWLIYGFSSQEEKIEYTEMLLELRLDRLGKSQEYFRALFIEYLQNEEATQKSLVAKQVVATQEWIWWEISLMMVDNLERSLQEYLESDDQELALISEQLQQNLDVFSSYRTFLHDFKFTEVDGSLDFEYEHRLSLSRLLVEVANKKIENERDDAHYYYEKAFELIPWSLSDNRLWFEDQNLQQASDKQLLLTADIFKSKRNQEIGWKNHQLSKVFLELASRQLSTGDIENAKRRYEQSLALHFPYDVQYEQTQDLLVLTTNSLEEAITSKNWQVAENILESLKILFPNNYDVQLLPGYYYLLRADLSVQNNDFERANNWISLAQDDFNRCNKLWKESSYKQHEECFDMAEYSFKLEELFLAKRFFFITQVIRSEKDWENLTH